MQPPVPLPGHGSGVVVVEISVLHPSVPAALVTRVLEVLVAVTVLANQRALAGFQLPVVFWMIGMTHRVDDGWR